MLPKHRKSLSQQFKGCCTMKKVLIALGLALMVFVVGTVWDTEAAPPSPFDPANYGLPTTIGRYEVLAVVNEKNSTCLRPSQKQLVVRAPDQSMDDFLKADLLGLTNKVLSESNFHDYAKSGWTVVGPRVTRTTVLDSLKAINQFNKTFGCTTLGPISTKMRGANATCLTRGFAVDVNRDPEIRFDLNAQSVLMVAPNVGNKQTCFSAFLNNVKTDTDYFLQTGMRFAQGSGSMMYATQQDGLFPRALPLGYVVGNTYRFTITNGSG